MGSWPEIELYGTRKRALAGLALVACGLVLGIVMMALGQGGHEPAFAHFPPNTGTATSQTPATPHPSLDFSIGVNTDGNGGTGNGAGDDCFTSGHDPQGGSAACGIPPATQFTVNIYLNDRAGISYRGFDTLLNFTGITVKHDCGPSNNALCGDPSPWPDCALPLLNFSSTTAAVGCAMRSGSSTYLGKIVTVVLNCDATS